MGLFRRSARQARPTDVLPAPVDPATQVGRAQLGRDAGPGMVAPHNEFTGPDQGGRAVLGRFVVDGGGTLDAIRTPESWYADRPLTGGAVAFPHFGEYVAEPGNTGGHQVITGRLPFVITEVEVVREYASGPPSLRQVPQLNSAGCAPQTEAS